MSEDADYKVVYEKDNVRQQFIFMLLVSVVQMSATKPTTQSMQKKTCIPTSNFIVWLIKA